MPTLRDLRERALLSPAELASICTVDRQTIYNWEHGRRRPTPEYQRKLVAALRCTPEELLAALRETSKQKEDEKQWAA
jgi:transcriptional regulator with XRE-family HTH domain